MTASTLFPPHPAFPHRGALAAALVLGTSLLTAAAPANADAITPVADAGAWVARAAMPTGRVWTRTLALDGRIYVLGGRTGWGPTTHAAQVLEIYDPATDRWHAGAPPQTDDMLTAAAAIDGRILFLQRQAGLLGFEYTPASDEWAPRPGAAAAFYSSPHCAAVACAGRLFAVHSTWQNQQLSARLLEYDFGRGQWDDRGAVPHGALGNLLAAGSRLYLIGGGTEGREAAEYDLAVGSWTRLPDLGTGRIEVRCAEWQGRLVAVGGHTSGTSITLATVEAYDPVSRSWSPLPPLPEPRWGVGVAACGGRLFVLGGCAASRGQHPAVATVWEYLPRPR